MVNHTVRLWHNVLHSYLCKYGKCYGSYNTPYENL